MIRTLSLLKAISVLATLAAVTSTATAQFPSLPKPSLPKPPSIPVPDLPKPPNIPTPTIPKPPNIPNPVEEARKQAARIDQLRKQADAVVNDFKRMKEEAEKAQRQYERLSKLARSDKPDASKEAYRALADAGVLKSNRSEVLKGINGGRGVVILAKEFDHFEEVELASALGASVATANPGPALVYVKKFAVESKTEVMKNLERAPARVRKKVQGEFEMLLIRGLEAAANGNTPPGFGIDGVDLTVAMATYNHWVEIRTGQPRLVATEKILGVQLYRIATDSNTIRVPLPNTFQPYLKVTVRTR